MKKLMHRLVYAALTLVVLLVVVLIIAFLYIDGLARRGVEYGASYALGVPTTLGGARVGVFSGKVGLTGLEVKNPAGFTTPHFLTLGDGRVAVTLGSLTKDTVEVPQLTLAGIDLSLEKKNGKSNYQVILDNLKKNEDPNAPKPKEQKEGKKFVIRELTIRDVTVHVDLLPVGGSLARANVKVPEIVLKDVGSGGPQGGQLADISGVVLKAILLAAVENGKGIIPADIQGDLTKGLGQLSSLAGQGVKVVGDLGAKIGNVGIKQIGGQATQGAGKALDTAGKAIGDLFNQGKDKK